MSNIIIHLPEPKAPKDCRGKGSLKFKLIRVACSSRSAGIRMPLLSRSKIFRDVSVGYNFSALPHRGSAIIMRAKLVRIFRLKRRGSVATGISNRARRRELRPTAYSNDISLGSFNH